MASNIDRRIHQILHRKSERSAREYWEGIDRQLMSSGLWRAKDGGYIPIKAMHTDHILKSIAKIMRDSWRVYYLPALAAELERRGVRYGPD